MKNATTAPLYNLLKSAHTVKALPNLIAEWNQNRYAGIEKVDNTPSEYSEGFDNELFPIESIVLPNRPTRGIVKARAGRAGRPNFSTPRPPGAKPPSNAEGATLRKYSDVPQQVRSYAMSVDSQYKYWSSPAPAFSNGNSNVFNKSVIPYVIYKKPAYVNKIVIGLENSYASPSEYKISITQDGVNWTVIGEDFPINAKGQIVIYRQANGSWSTIVSRNSPIQIKGIKLLVTKMDKPNYYFNLIELSGRLERDLTPYLISFDSSFSMSDHSFKTPLGVASSNTANVRLDNPDGLFNNENPDSMYKGLIDHNVTFTMSINYDAADYAGFPEQPVKEFTMHTDEWDAQTEEQVSVSLKDSSKFLQELPIGPTFYENKTIGQIIWSLCDKVGFSRWIYSKSSTDVSTLVPYFWTKEGDTVWSVFSQIAETTQSAIFFDENDNLRIQTRDAAYDISKPIAWQLDAEASSFKPMPDIVELNKTYDFEVNSVDVAYKTTKISDYNNGYPKMEVVWQPETLVLRAAPLRNSLIGDHNTFVLPASQGQTWPYTSVVQIDGEFIRYEGKGYYFYNLNGFREHRYLKSEEEKVNVDTELTRAELRYKSEFSGIFRIIERGLWNTSRVDHYVEAGSYYARYGIGSGQTTWGGGFIQNRDESTVTLATNGSKFGGNTIYMATRGVPQDQRFVHMGTRLRMQAGGYYHGAGGLVFHAGTGSGYFVEIVRTEALAWMGNRSVHHELNFYARYPNGVVRRIGANGGKGIPLAINKAQWYDLDVYCAIVGSNHEVSILVDGVLKMNLTVPAGSTVAPSGSLGIFTRGFTRCDFEYLYGITYPEPTILDAESFYDKVRGGYVSGQWDKEWTYKWQKTYRIIKGRRQYYEQRWAQRLFDEFGPIVHEVREFDIKFDKAPVVHSSLYFSNDYQVIVPEYRGNAFGAKMIMANAARTNAVVNGEDKITYGAENPVDQVAMIYGRVVYQEDEKVYNVKNQDAIVRRGESTLEISSDWIQTESAAKLLGEWISKHWSNGCDEVTVKVFGNNLFQIGDCVSVNYRAKDMNPLTHVYFIVGIQNSFDEGLETELTLRRNKFTVA